MRERFSNWLRRYPFPTAIASVVLVLAALIQIVNGLPDFFDRSLPWLGTKVNLGDFVTTVWQVVWVVPLVAALALLVAIFLSSRTPAGSSLGELHERTAGGPATPVTRTPAEIVETSIVADGVISPLTPYPWRELTQEQQQPWRDRLCKAREDLLVEGKRLDAETVKPAADAVVRGPTRVWIANVRTYAMDHWRITAPQFRQQVSATKVKRSSFPFRTEIRQHLTWLEAHGTFCDGSDNDQPSKAAIS